MNFILFYSILEDRSISRPGTTEVIQAPCWTTFESKKNIAINVYVCVIYRRASHGLAPLCTYNFFILRCPNTLSLVSFAGMLL